MLILLVEVLEWPKAVYDGEKNRYTTAKISTVASFGDGCNDRNFLGM